MLELNGICHNCHFKIWGFEGCLLKKHIVAHLSSQFLQHEFPHFSCTMKYNIGDYKNQKILFKLFLQRWNIHQTVFQSFLWGTIMQKCFQINYFRTYKKMAGSLQRAWFYIFKRPWENDVSIKLFMPLQNMFFTITV